MWCGIGRVTGTDKCLELKIFGRWTVLGRCKDYGKVSCICSCGTTRDVNVSQLLKGLTKSCGCLCSELSSERRKQAATMKVGDRYTANSGGEFEVIDYLDCDNVKVQFIINGNVTTASAGNIRKGEVLDVYNKSLCGVGYIGEGEYNASNSPIAYSHWSHMIGRCYSSNYGITYQDCSVSPEWHCFQIFAEWYNNNKKDFKGALDKDILHKGNKVYCPSCCEIIPKALNSFLCKADAIRGDLPIGVVKREYKGVTTYIAQVYYKGCHEGLGTYTTILEAFNTYKRRKEEIGKELADYYFSKKQISEEMYNALYNYQVEITD